MHKYLEFISVGLLIANEPVAFNGHGEFKKNKLLAHVEKLTCLRRDYKNKTDA